MRKKVTLAAALLHSPSVLLLDEPFESVDPVSSRVISEVLQQYREIGGTIVFSSHVMETVERLCDHVATVSDGRVARSGPMAEVLGARTNRLEDVFIEVVGADDLSEWGALAWLGERV